jgi:hypothetical protein
MVTSIKDNINIKLNLRERNNSILRTIYSDFTNKNDNKIILNLNKNTSLKISTIEDECSICLQKIKLNQIIRETKCNHKYHAKCLDRWLEEKSLCPLCKNNLLITSS